MRDLRTAGGPVPPRRANQLSDPCRHGWALLSRARAGGRRCSCFCCPHSSPCDSILGPSGVPAACLPGLDQGGLPRWPCPARSSAHLGGPSPQRTRTSLQWTRSLPFPFSSAQTVSTTKTGSPLCSFPPALTGGSSAAPCRRVQLGRSSREERIRGRERPALRCALRLQGPSLPASFHCTERCPRCGHVHMPSLNYTDSYSATF